MNNPPWKSSRIAVRLCFPTHLTSVNQFPSEPGYSKTFKNDAGTSFDQAGNDWIMKIGMEALNLAGLAS